MTISATFCASLLLTPPREMLGSVQAATREVECEKTLWMRTWRDGEAYLLGNCSPKGCLLCFKLHNVISEAYVFTCPGFAIKQNIALSVTLDVVIRSF